MKAIQAIGQGDQEDRVQRQGLENQLMQMRADAADASIPEAIRSVEDKKLEETRNDDQPEKGNTAALERLRGRKDSFAPRDETLNTDDDRAAEHSIEGLKRSIESMERRALDTLDPDEARSLDREIENARVQLRQKGSDAYRRQFARYAAIFRDREPRAALQQGG